MKKRQKLLSDEQTGAAWRFLPDEYPSPSTCWRRLKQWEEAGIWLNAWRTRFTQADSKIEEQVLSYAIKPVEAAQGQNMTDVLLEFIQNYVEKNSPKPKGRRK